MQGDNTVALAAIALAGTLAAGFFKLLNKLSKSIDSNTRAHEQVAIEIKKGNQEAKERNGHLGELVEDSKKATLVAIQNIPQQHVEHQHVDKQEIKESNNGIN